MTESDTEDSVYTSTRVPRDETTGDAADESGRTPVVTRTRAA